ncbi:hypothetical protein [Lacticaseibacillus saniviri]
MQFIMYLGIAVAAIGLLISAATTRWVNGWVHYATTNRPLAFLGWLLLIIGIAMLVLPLILNGTLKW